MSYKKHDFASLSKYDQDLIVKSLSKRFIKASKKEGYSFPRGKPQKIVRSILKNKQHNKLCIFHGCGPCQNNPGYAYTEYIAPQIGHMIPQSHQEREGVRLHPKTFRFVCWKHNWAQGSLSIADMLGNTLVDALPDDERREYIRSMTGVLCDLLPKISLEYI